MKNFFTKENMKPIIVLSAICLFVAALLGVVNYITAPEIERVEAQKVYDSLRVVIDGTFEPVDPLPENASDTITGLYRVTDGETLVGHAVTVKVRGYADDIYMTVGVDAEGKVTKAVVTSQKESHGKSGMANYTDNYDGVASDELADVDTFSGATRTSGAIKRGIIDAVNVSIGGEISAPDEEGGGGTPTVTMPRADSEVIALAKNLVGENAELTDVTPSYNRPATLLRLYEISGGGHVAYVATAGAYVSIANEGLVHIDKNGDIVAVDYLQWVVGHGVGNDGFAERFIGKDYWTVGDVELVASATGTSQDFRAAVLTALDTVIKMTSRTEDKLASLMHQLVPNSKCFEKIESQEDAPKELVSVYRVLGGRGGYVAHYVVAGEYTPLASEALVYYNGRREIVDMDLLVWNVGHGVEPGDFEDRFIGVDEKTVSDVELVAGATGTSADLRTAITDSMPYIPKNFPIARFMGVFALILAAGFVTVAVIYTKRRKNG